jgi:hypothetical protein
MRLSRRHRHTLFAAAAAALIASNLGVAPASASASTLWTSFLRDPGWSKAMAVADDGSHHILLDDSKVTNSSYYATDRTGKWVITQLFGGAADLALDSDGNAWFITFASTGNMTPALRLYHMEDGAAVYEEVTAFGTPGSQPSNLAGMAIDSTGTIHIAWSSHSANTAWFRSRSSEGWSDTGLVETALPSLNGLDLDVPGDVPTLFGSGIFFSGSDTRPEGCSENVDERGCTVAITLTDPQEAVGFGYDFEPGLLDVTVDDSGHVHGVVRGNTVLSYVTNSTGSWTDETVATVNTYNASIAVGPSGPVVFWAGGSNGGIRRVDRGQSGWTTTTVTTSPDTGAFGYVDANNVSHIAIGRVVRHPTEDVVAAYLIAPDFVPPIVGKPRVAPTKGKQIGASTVPSTISWTASDAGSGLAKYQLQRSTSGGSFATVSSTLPAKSTTQTLTSGTNYAYRVRGWDKEGFVSSYSTGPTLKIDRYQDTTSAIQFAGSWTRAAFAEYSRGSVKYSNSKTATATVTFTGRGFAWVSSYGPNRGIADVIVDGIPLAEVSTYKSTKSYRMIVWSISWEESGLHTVQIKPRGTAGHPRIDVDAVLLVR